MSQAMHWFRRYQKIFLAVFGVLLMFGFVVWEPLYRLFVSDPGQAQNPVVVRTNFETLTERDLQMLKHSRFELNRFFQAFAQMTADALVRSRQLGQFPPQQLQNLILRQLSAEGLVGQQYLEDESIVRQLILDHKAEQLGMHMSDEAVFNFLQQRSGGVLTADQLRALLTQLNIPQRQIFNALRNVLLANRLQQLVFGINAFQGTTPSERFDYFERLERKINAEVLPIQVAAFVDQVKEPDVAELRVLYEKYKNKYPDPETGEPGFRVPPKGKFEGFKASYEEFAKNVQVTQQEIEEHYEKNKELYRYSALGESDDTPFAESSPAAATPPAVSPDSSSTEGQQPPTEQSPAEQPAAEAPASPPAAETAPADESKTPPAAEQSPPPESKSPGGGGDDAGGAAPEQPPAAAAESQPAASADTPPADQPASTETPATTPAADAAPPATEPPSTTEPAVPVGPVTPKIEFDESLVLPSSIMAGPNPEYDPLWKVEDRIRKELIGEKVNQKIDEVFDSLAAALEDYANQLDLYEEEKEEKGDQAKPPARPDYAKLASQYAVLPVETQMVSAFDLQGSDLAASSKDGRPFGVFAFDQLKPYVIERTQDIEGDRFLFWKVAETKDEVPDFNKSRDAVLAAYRNIEARKLAKQYASQLAAKAQDEHRSLREIAGPNEVAAVKETGFFSWMTEQSALTMQMGRGRPLLSTVPNVVSPGDRFMRTVFALSPGQVGAALNEPETTVYVVRVLAQEPSEEQLYDLFAKAQYQDYVGVAERDERESTLAWDAQLKQEAGVVWERPVQTRSIEREF